MKRESVPVERFEAVALPRKGARIHAVALRRVFGPANPLWADPATVCGLRTRPFKRYEAHKRMEPATVVSGYGLEQTFRAATVDDVTCPACRKWLARDAEARAAEVDAIPPVGASWRVGLPSGGSAEITVLPAAATTRDAEDAYLRESNPTAAILRDKFTSLLAPKAKP